MGEGVRVGIVCVWQGKEKNPPATGIGECPHRDRGKRGAERPKTRLRGGVEFVPDRVGDTSARLVF